MSLTERIDVGYARQVAPHFIPFVVNFPPNVFREILSVKIDEGFGYWLRYVTVGWYDYWDEAQPKYLGDPEIEFFALRIARQTAPLKPHLISSPTAYLPNFIDAGHLRALQTGSRKFLNYFYAFGENVEIHLTRGSNARDTQAQNPAFTAHLLLHGYTVPEPKARIW